MDPADVGTLARGCGGSGGGGGGGGGGDMPADTKDKFAKASAEAKALLAKVWGQQLVVEAQAERLTLVLNEPCLDDWHINMAFKDIASPGAQLADDWELKGGAAPAEAAPAAAPAADPAAAPAVAPAASVAAPVASPAAGGIGAAGAAGAAALMPKAPSFELDLGDTTTVSFRELLRRDFKCTRAPGPVCIFEDDAEDMKLVAYFKCATAEDLLRLSARATGLWVKVQRLSILDDENKRRVLTDFAHFYGDLEFDLAVAEATWVESKAKTDGVHRALREANELQARILALGGRYETSSPRWLPEVRNQGAMW